MKKFCETCGLLDPKLQKCRLFGHQVEPTADFCSRHGTPIISCGLCGSMLLASQAVVNTKGADDITLICRQCSSLYGTCALCKHGNSCSFETDPSPLPKVVQRKIQQGNATMVTQIKNPERIEITCKQNCPCYDQELECLKQYNNCGKYE